MFNTVVGYAKHKSTVVGMGEKECYVGDQAIQKRGTLLLKVSTTPGPGNASEPLE
jgi:hypothetical protein